MRHTTANYFRALCILAAGIIMQTSATMAGEVIGWMDITPSDEQIQISGRAYAASESRIEYTLQIERIGRGGKSATKQSGKATLEPGETAKLSTTSVNIGSGDQLAILLTVSSGGKIVSTSALNIGDH